MSITDNALSGRVIASAGPEPVRPPVAPSTSGVGVIEIDLDTRTVLADNVLLDMIGSTKAQLDTDQNALIERVHPDERRAIREAIAHVTGPRRERFRLATDSNGTYRWFEARFDVDPSVASHITAAIVDIDDLFREQSDLSSAHADLADSQRFHRAVIAATPDAIHVYDIATRSLTRVVQSRQRLYDFSDEAVAVISGEQVERFVPGADRAQLRDTFKLAAVLPDQHTASLRHRVVAADGTTYWLRRRMGVLNRDPRGRATSLIVVSSEVTNVVSVERRLAHAADHDESTGLANRRKFVAELAARITDGEQVAIAVLDITGLKSLSDNRGRDTADAVLAAVARRLSAAVRKHDLIARLGDTEFGLMVSATQPSERSDDDVLDAVIADTDVTRRVGEAAPSVTSVEQIVERIEDLLAEPFYVDDVEIALSASSGICEQRPDDDAKSIMRAAYAAVDKARESGNGGRHVFDSLLEDELRMQEHIERNLRRALRDDALEVYYQPIVAPQSGRVTSVEALVRLHDEDGMMLPVDQVIAVAERCALVTELDDQMLMKASRQVAQWRRDPEYAGLRLALNRSAKDLNRSGFHDRIMRRLVASDLPSEALTIEITETVLLHIDLSRIEEMKRLRSSLVGLAIDDFGTGYASLSQLVSLPISRIKIDRSFTARMLEDPTCAALVSASVGIASDLGLSCVVEGVETVEQLDALPSYDQLLVQGYIYGKPRPGEIGLGINDIDCLRAKN